MLHHETKLQRVRDWVLYVGIALFIAASALIFGVYQAKTGGSPNLPLKWLGFAGMTVIVFGYAIRACRRSWEKQKFWVLLGLFFAVHSILGTLVLTKLPTVPLVLYAVLTGPEYVLLAAYLGFFLDSDGRAK